MPDPGYTTQTFITLYVDNQLDRIRSISTEQLPGGTLVTAASIGNANGPDGGQLKLIFEAPDLSIIKTIDVGLPGSNHFEDDPVLFTTSDGGFVLSWTDRTYDGSTLSAGDVYVQRFDANGTALWVPRLVNAAADGSGGASAAAAQTLSAVTELQNGNIVATWTTNEAGNQDVHFSLITNSAAIPGITDQAIFGTTDFTERNPTVTPLYGRGFLITYESNAGKADPTDFDIYGILYDQNGVLDKGPTLLAGGAGAQIDAFLTVLKGPDGALGAYPAVMTWTSQGQIFGSRITIEGNAAVPFTVSDDPSYGAAGRSVVDLHPDGGFIVAYQIEYSGQILARSYNPDATPVADWFYLGGSDAPAWEFEVRPDGNPELSYTGPEYAVGSQLFTPLRVSGAGTAGDDVIRGSSIADEINGLGGNDKLYGMAGNDILSGGPGDDLLDGGEGTDTASYKEANGPVTVVLANGYGDATGEGSDSLFNIENIIGSFFNDTLIGDDLANKIEGLNGNDVIAPGKGGDWIIGGPGYDSVDYYNSNGTVVVNLTLGQGFNNYAAGDIYDGIEAVLGSAYDDILIGNELDNSLFGAGGNDLLVGALGRDALNGGDGIDTVNYSDSIGTVFVNLTLGKGFNNSAEGDIYVSIENVEGSAYADFIIGDAGVNRLDGSGGNDTLLGALGADVLVGGDGSDWASYEDNQGAVFINLTLARGYNNAAEGDTYSGIENLVGGLMDDFFIGDEHANRLNGAMGADTLLGAGGADIFMFTYAPGATSAFGRPNVDLILDFTTGEDKIELSSGAFAGLSTGALPAAAFYAGTAAHDADDRIIYDAATGNLWFDSDGNGASAAMLFATLGESSHPASIAAGDFAVV